MINHHQALVVQYVPIVVVVQHHGRATVIPHILNSLGVWDCIRTLMEHMRNMVRVQCRVNFWVQTVHQLHTMSSANTVRS